MAAIVSRDSDFLVLVDSEDRAIGLREKLSCHEGRGALHRAVSVFLFDSRGYLLLQQRHPDKQLWGGYWSNSCCTHPFYKELPLITAKRRVQEELGLSVELEYVYKFEYRSEWPPAHCEHELCGVFVGRAQSNPTINPTEIAAWRWEAPGAVDALVEDDATATPWFRMEWLELRKRGFPS